MANVDTRRSDRNGIRDRSSGRIARALRIAQAHGPLGLIRLVRQHGLSASLAFIARNLRHLIAAKLARNWDRNHDVDTAGSIQLASLEVVGTNRDLGNECVCTSPKSFDFIMRNLPSDLSAYTFIDIGSGKSRTLLLASRYGFARIVGVEFARELVEIARSNIRQFRDPRQKSRDLSVIEADAATYAFPDGPLVVYFYNPFSQEVFDIVLGNLLTSLRQNPRDCYLVYGSSSHNAIGWAKPAIGSSGQFEEQAVPAMPFFFDAVRTIDYAVFRYRKTGATSA